MSAVGGNRGSLAADKQGIRKEKGSGEAVCVEGSGLELFVRESHVSGTCPHGGTARCKKEQNLTLEKPDKK